MYRKIILIALIIISIIPNILLCQDYSQQLDSLIRKYMKLDIFSGVVLLAKDGNPVYKKAFGYSDWKNKTENNTETLFNICSINKVFTHSIILQLEKEGKLKLSDPLNKYLSIYTDNTGEKITIKMLIEMQAGLGDYLNDPEYNSSPGKYTSVNEYLELIKKEPLLFEPGTDRRYSNSGYVVLGGIIEKVTGKSYTDNLKERFFIPLGMNNTFYKQINDNLSNSAVGTRIIYNGNKLNQLFETSPSPAGGLRTNADDLLKFDNELRRTKIMRGFNAWAGGTPAWNAILGQIDEHYTLIILSNLRLVAEEVFKRFNSILNGKPYPEPDLLPDIKFYKILKEEGITGLEKSFKTILANNHFEYNDMHLNMFGYNLMENSELELALEVFELNAKLFPDISNVFDSLGDAYMEKGDKDKARENYKKAIALQPGNLHSKQMLDKLQE
jgi:hypothetical protein